MDDLVALESQLSELLDKLAAMADLHSDEPDRCSKLRCVRASAEHLLELVREQLAEPNPTGSRH